MAYTWFNRFSALRFMEVNGYLPSHVRVFTDDENNFRPQILAEAIHLELDGLNMDKVYALKEKNDDEALFKYLLITQCNALSAILPGMFQLISDYTELLFPDNLLRSGSVLEQMISLIPEADWQDQVQIIGWLYQYYNTEPKDKVFADLKKNIKITKENIPAATQLFTPDWIVRYMVENSLGRLWVEGHHSDELKTGWKYYLEEAKQEPEVQAQLEKIREEYKALKPEEIRCIDPCMGSGHILVYLFDVLMQIYASCGYSDRDAVRSIIENNLYGLDIDDRAAQLAYFSVMMKARQYDARFFSRKLQPHVYAICESNGLSADMVDYFVGGDAKLKKDMDSLITEMRDAKEYGSILNITPVDFEALYARFDAFYDEISMYNQPIFNDLLPIVRVAQALAQKYSVVCTNPPYMGSSGMGAKLGEYVKKNYPDSKSDLFACFIEKGNSMVEANCYNCMVTMQSWMFLSSFEKMRTRIVNTNNITNLMHMDNMVMGIAFGTAVTVFRNCHIKGYKGTYNQIKLSDIENDRPKEFPVQGSRFAQVSTDNFSKIPGSPIAYWVTNPTIDLFLNENIQTYTLSDGQNKTGNNEKYIRSWWEVKNGMIGCEKKWVLCARGGEFRKWYGNIDEVIDWSKTAREHYRKDHVARIIPDYIWYRKGFSWSRITSYKPSYRIQKEDMLFEMTGLTLFWNTEESHQYFLGFLNSKPAEYLLRILTQVMTIQLRDVQALPIVFDKKKQVLVPELVDTNVKFSSEDWDSFETSWDFKRHPLVRYSHDLWDATSVAASMSYYYHGHPKVNSPLELCYMLWQGECNDRFSKLKANEEELNRIFIDIYGLQDELTPEVEDKDVTVRLADKKRDIRSLISYAVGCMFGRYSLDVEGLAYAGGAWDASKYSTFLPDRDNIIPICDDEYFEDDITGRFAKFIETVYGKETLDENLRFIADALGAGSPGGSSGQPKDVIRSYFLNDFYADHLKIYQKRPIYWLFDSGKKNGFKALIYMHRYAPDTLARMRTDYVHEQQARYRTAIADVEHRIDAASASERVKLTKQLAKLTGQSDEIRVYEEKIHHLADQMIRIDLDDGVKHNYEIFGDVLAKIK